MASWIRGPFCFYAFDLVWLNGSDLRGRPLLERKRALRKLLPLAPRIKPDGSGDSVAVNRQVPFLGFTGMTCGLYFVTFWEGKSRVQRLSPDGKIKDVLELPFTSQICLSLTPDERYVLVTKPDENGSDLMLVEGFH
jgi:hypothetical protein